MAATRLRATALIWLRPLLVLTVALGLGTLLMAPMVNMEPRDLPIAVVDLDEGVQTPQGTANVGEQLAESIRTDDMDGMVAWQPLRERSMLDQALEGSEIYAALVIPEDFTESQMSAQQGQGEVSPLELILNEGKNPMVTAQLSDSLVGLTSGSEVPVEMSHYNQVPDDLGLLAGFLPMVFMLLVYISSYATGIVTRSSFPLGASGRGKVLTAQLGIATIAATVIGFATAGIMSAMVDLDFSLVGAGVFLTISSFALMTLVMGSINWVGMVGMAVPVLILVLGLGPADLPFEFLPAFWQELVYPWNPLRFLAEGARALLYQGAGWWNAATPGMVTAAILGMVLVGASGLTPRGRRTINEIAEV